MNIVELPLVCLHPAHWNPNTLAPPKRSQLKSSVTMFDIVENLVVRVLANNTYEVLSGNQRLEVYREMGLKTAPCVVVDLSDAEARLLAQVLNRLHGEDDLWSEPWRGSQVATPILIVEAAPSSRYANPTWKERE